MFDLLSQQLSSVFSQLTGRHKLTQKNVRDVLRKVRESLLDADVPYDVVESFLSQVQNDVVGRKIAEQLKPGEQFVHIVHERLTAFLSAAESTSFTFTSPATVLVVGLQGSGKTTTVAKLAQRCKKEKSKQTIAVTSVDFCRPAALEQLAILAQDVGVPFLRSSQRDPVHAARELAEQARRQQYDLLLVDTAGRLHIDKVLLSELQAVQQEFCPQKTVLVLDAMTGQESLAVAKAFDENINFSGAILSKLDSESRAGAAFAFAYALEKPIFYVGTGEKIDDLEPFVPDRMAGRMIGMGDLTTLVERAEEKIQAAEQKKMEESLKKGQFTLEDFCNQMAMVDRIGSLSSIARYLPGMKGVTPEMLAQGERELKKGKAIMSSMTRKERLTPVIIGTSRKKRIARGAGVLMNDVDLLLTKFEETKRFVKLFKGFM